MTLKPVTPSFIDKNFLSQFFQEDSNPIALKDSFGNLDELQARSRNLGKLLSGNPTEVDQATTDNLNETIDAVAHYLDQIIRGQMFRPKSVKQAKPFQFLKKNVFEPLLQNASPLFKKMISEDLKGSLNMSTSDFDEDLLETFTSAVSNVVSSLVPFNADSANVNPKLFSPQAINSYLNANFYRDVANLRRESSKLGKAIRDHGSLKGPRAQLIRNIIDGLSGYIVDKFKANVTNPFELPGSKLVINHALVPILQEIKDDSALKTDFLKLLDLAFFLGASDKSALSDNQEAYDSSVAGFKKSLLE